jgi:hypothetical protein
MTTDIERAVTMLLSKQEKCRKNQQYYDGTEPLVYSTERLREAFGDRLARFAENWCAVVVDSTLDRIELDEFDVLNNTEADGTLDELLKESDLSIDADDVHKDAMIQEESYVIVWKDARGEVQFYHNPAHMCHVFYRADNPKEKRYAAKWFQDEVNGFWHVTLYYPDKLKYYVSKKKDSVDAKSFESEKADARNPFGAIPVFHFRCPGDLKNVIVVQDAINKLVSDMMVAAEYGAFKQRYVISNADVSQLKNAPNQVWDIPAGDGVGQGTQVGEFSGEDLAKFHNAIDKFANYISIVTRTPKNYLVDVGAGISGDALIAMEAPLVKKAEKRIKMFGRTWKEVMAFALKLKSMDVKKSDIVPVFSRVRSEQPLAEFQAINFGTSSKIPLKTILRRQGWTKKDLLQLDQDMQEEATNNKSLAKVLLESARNSTDQNDETGATV